MWFGKRGDTWTGFSDCNPVDFLIRGWQDNNQACVGRIPWACLILAVFNLTELLKVSSKGLTSLTVSLLSNVRGARVPATIVEPLRGTDLNIFSKTPPLRCSLFSILSLTDDKICGKNTDEGSSSNHNSQSQRRHRPYQRLKSQSNDFPPRFREWPAEIFLRRLLSP